jgi:N6-adenosine-specific RNA methylase IME4
MKTIKGYKVHPAANYFPLIEGEEFDALVADIKAHGQHEPIMLCDGKILDGRNRMRACKAAKLEPRVAVYGGEDPLGYVVSLNLKRRHLSESQRALAAAKIADGTHGGDRRSSGKPAARTQAQAARELSTSPRAVRQAKKVLTIGTPELVEAVQAGTIAVSVAEKMATMPVRAQREAVREATAGAKPAAVLRELNRKEREKKMRQIKKGDKKLAPVKKYGVVYADPAWQYREGTTTPNRTIDNHYPQMALDEICALPVDKLALPDAVLFLWIPSPLIFEYGPTVLAAWGFEYKAQMIWEKVSKRRGTGYWVEGVHEHLLICKRGDAPPPPVKQRHRSVTRAELGEHSRKPEVFRKRIKGMYPDATRIELFAREKTEGWDVWGNQS